MTEDISYDTITEIHVIRVSLAKNKVFVEAFLLCKLTLILKCILYLYFVVLQSGSFNLIKQSIHRRLSWASAFCKLIMLRDSYTDWSSGMLIGSDTTVDGISLSGIKSRLCSQCQFKH